MEGSESFCICTKIENGTDVCRVNNYNLWQNSAYQAFFPILNVAIGTNFPRAENGGQPNSSTATGLGSGMQIHYVAFYQSSVATAPALVVQQ